MDLQIEKSTPVEILEEIKKHLGSGRAVSYTFYDINSWCDMCGKERNKVYLVSLMNVTKDEAVGSNDSEDFMSGSLYGFGTTCWTKMKRLLKASDLAIDKVIPEYYELRSGEWHEIKES